MGIPIWFLTLFVVNSVLSATQQHENRPVQENQSHTLCSCVAWECRSIADLGDLALNSRWERLDALDTQILDWQISPSPTINGYERHASPEPVRIQVAWESMMCATQGKRRPGRWERQASAPGFRKMENGRKWWIMEKSVGQSRFGNQQNTTVSI
jgi:hypothetical protein